MHKYSLPSGSSGATSYHHLHRKIHCSLGHDSLQEEPTATWQAGGFLTSQSRRLQQHGGSGSLYTLRGGQHPGSSTGVKGLSAPQLGNGGSSGSSTPSTQNPAKSNARRESASRNSPAFNMEVSPAQTSGTATHPDPIAAFPTLGHPVSDTVLKDMLLSL